MPSDEDTARYILDLFVNHFNNRVGGVLRINNFLSFFAEHPWQAPDFKPGIIYAAEQDWLEILSDCASYRLTEKGFSEAGGNGVNLKQQCNEQITIEGKDGSRHENVPSFITANMILVPDEKVPIKAGDAILRQLPSGTVERLLVTSPGFHASMSGIPGHYQVKYQHEGQQPAGNPGYVLHVTGENSRVNINSVDNSTNSVSYVSQNMNVLVEELSRLREALVPQARTSEDYIAIGAISQAEVAAKESNPSKVSSALSALGHAGKSTFQNL